MRPTRRGYVALGIVVSLILAALLTGSEGRALNAMAAPILVAVGAGAFHVHRAGEPEVTRTEPSKGFPGESRTVELSVEGSGVGFVTESVQDGLSGTTQAERTLPATFSYEITYERRGVHTLGPTTVRVRDVLGLVETTYESDELTTVVVYPRVYSMGDPESFLRTLGPETTDRTEFDRLREYVPGDSLRDVNWKTSAKYDELLVTEYADPTDEEAVAIAATSEPGHDDEMATAVATLFASALKLGLSARLTVPGGTLGQGFGELHKHKALELLARTGSGTVSEDEWDEADVRVHADDTGVSVTIDGNVHAIEDLTATRENPLLTGVAT